MLLADISSPGPARASCVPCRLPFCRTHCTAQYENLLATHWSILGSSCAGWPEPGAEEHENPLAAWLRCCLGARASLLSTIPVGPNIRTVISYYGDTSAGGCVEVDQSPTRRPLKRYITCHPWAAKGGGCVHCACTFAGPLPYFPPRRYWPLLAYWWSRPTLGPIDRSAAFLWPLSDAAPLACGAPECDSRPTFFGRRSMYTVRASCAGLCAPKSGAAEVTVHA